jgi:hypothetical protein
MIENTRLRDSVSEGSGAIPGRPAVPWVSVVLLAAVMAYADGFWIMSLRGAVGAIERTQEPFASWLRESTTALPLFVVAVLAALALALRRFGPALSRPRTVIATGLLVAAAGTLVGVAETAASSAWDYVLQLQLMASMHHAATGGSLPSLNQASLGLQLVALGYGSGILLITNVVLTGWTVAMRGGRLDVVSRIQRRLARSTHIDHSRLFVAVALFSSAAIHGAVIPGHLGHWVPAGAFFLVLALAELILGFLMLGRHHRDALPAVAAASIVPLALWLWSRTAGLPFGPDAGIPEPVGLADSAACILELATLVAAVVLLRGGNALPGRKGATARPPASAHLRSITAVAAIAIGVLGMAGTVPGWFGDAGSASDISHSAHP